MRNLTFQMWKELNEFEKTTPSHLAFRALVALVEIWPIDEQENAIDYAEKNFVQLA